MKKYFFIAVSAMLLLSCGQIILPTGLPGTTTSRGQLSNTEIINGLKEALKIGAQNSTGNASAVDGFYKNQLLFIPFPQEAIEVKNTLEKAGFKKPVDDFVLSLNRAAEEASKKAYPIFADAILGMSITDAMGILKGADNAATSYLKTKTSQQLAAAFKPIVNEALQKVKVTSYWTPVVNTYNKLTILTGTKQVNPNLEEYVTGKAIDGLFVLIANEEAKIRKDPAARVTELLKKVFAKQ